ncbi:ATP-binding protein, partial [Sphaerochaeta sp. S2]|uniref:ATP-binding protein n=1 Tax=Sphaerochaeta sp. S2 TaxID=2798868 RepID=UPI001E648FBA
QLLGSICMETLKVTAGVDTYPRLGDFVFAAPHDFVSLIPELMDLDSNESIMLDLGTVDVAVESSVKIKPEKLFGRHLAILGSTGGGKSWTTAKILEECMEYNSKIILIDATGEYRGIVGDEIEHWHLSSPVKTALDSKECKLPPTCFQESDFIALFEPSGKVQGPILREAIRSLRLSNLFPDTFPDGYIEKINQSKDTYNEVLAREDVQLKIDNPMTPFDVAKLTLQIEQECVYPNGYKNDISKWGDMNGNLTYCLPLLTRINGVLASPAFSCVFTPEDRPSLVDIISKFFASPKKLLRIDLSGIPFEYKAREIISNVIGRHLLNQSRSNTFQDKPLLLFLDEAHNFLGKNIGSEDTVAKLDSFELIAKEGRKFGLNIILATQRPRDITEGVLSQIGTLIVHRLTNDRDREVVERACGEIDKAASSFLPNLKPGEAVIIGNDFPIPLTMQIHAPRIKPKSSGPDFQNIWRIPAYSHNDSLE